MASTLVLVTCQSCHDDSSISTKGISILSYGDDGDDGEYAAFRCPKCRKDGMSYLPPQFASALRRFVPTIQMPDFEVRPDAPLTEDDLIEFGRKLHSKDEPEEV